MCEGTWEECRADVGSSIQARSIGSEVLGASSGIRCCRLQPASFLALSLKSPFPTVFVFTRVTCVNLILSANLFRNCDDATKALSSDQAKSCQGSDLFLAFLQ